MGPGFRRSPFGNKVVGGSKAPAIGFPTSAPNAQTVNAMPIRVPYSLGFFDRVAMVAGDREIKPPETNPKRISIVIMPHVLCIGMSHARTAAPEVR